MQIPFNPQYSNTPVSELANKAAPKLVGDVPLAIVEADIKPTKDGAGQAVVLKFVAIAGEFQGLEYQHFYNVVNPNPKAVEIAYQELAKLAQAIGLSAIPQNTEQLLNQRFIGTFKLEKQKDYIDKDGIQREGGERGALKGYKPFAQQQAPAQAQQANPFAQAQQGNPFAQQQPVMQNAFTNDAPF